MNYIYHNLLSLLVIGGISSHTKADWQIMPSTVSTTHTWSNPFKFITAGDLQRYSPHTGPCLEWFGICFFILRVFSSYPPVFDIIICPMGENSHASFFLPLPHVNAHLWPQPIGDHAWLTPCPSFWDVNLVFLCWPIRSQEKTTVFQMTRL